MHFAWKILASPESRIPLPTFGARFFDAITRLDERSPAQQLGAIRLLAIAPHIARLLKPQERDHILTAISIFPNKGPLEHMCLDALLALATGERLSQPSPLSSEQRAATEDEVTRLVEGGLVQFFTKPKNGSRGAPSISDLSMEVLHVLEEKISDLLQEKIPSPDKISPRLERLTELSIEISAEIVRLEYDAAKVLAPFLNLTDEERSRMNDVGAAQEAYGWAEAELGAWGDPRRALERLDRISYLPPSLSVRISALRESAQAMLAKLPPGDPALEQFGQSMIHRLTTANGIEQIATIRAIAVNPNLLRFQSREIREQVRWICANFPSGVEMAGEISAKALKALDLLEKDLWSPPQQSPEGARVFRGWEILGALGSRTYASVTEWITFLDPAEINLSRMFMVRRPVEDTDLPSRADVAEALFEVSRRIVNIKLRTDGQEAPLMPSFSPEEMEWLRDLSNPLSQALLAIRRGSGAVAVRELREIPEDHPQWGESVLHVAGRFREERKWPEGVSFLEGTTPQLKMNDQTAEIFLVLVDFYLEVEQFQMARHLMFEINQQLGSRPVVEQKLAEIRVRKDLPTWFLEPMKRFGIFEVIEEVGEGGQATIYRAWDPDYKREVAVKVVKDLSDSERTHARDFVGREIRIMDTLKHPNILSVIDCDFATAQPYFVTQYVPGTNLQVIVEERRRKSVGAFTPAEVVEMGIPIANALVEAHTKGIIHRDIKPENILVAHAGGGYGKHYWLADFGIAKALPEGARNAKVTVRTDLDGRELVMGTPDYAAPEIAMSLKAEPTAYPSSDIYSLGAVFLFLLTGHDPRRLFSRDRIRHLESPHGDPIPRPLVKLVRDCLYQNPQKRPTAKEVHQRLAQIQHDFF